MKRNQCLTLLFSGTLFFLLNAGFAAEQNLLKEQKVKIISQTGKMESRYQNRSIAVNIPAAPKGWPILKLGLPQAPANTGTVLIEIRLDTPNQEVKGGISLAPSDNPGLAKKLWPYLGGKETVYINGRLKYRTVSRISLPYDPNDPLTGLTLAARRPENPVQLTITGISFLPKALPGANLLMNSALDSEQSDFPPFWYTQTPTKTRYTRSGGPGGKGAVIMQGDANLRQQGMVLAGGETYRLSGMFKTRNFKAKSFMFVVHNFAWQKDVGFRSIPQNPDGWVKLEQDLVLVPSNTPANVYGVALHIAGATGELMATDLKLEPLSEKARTDSKNPMAIPARQIIPLSPLLTQIPVENPVLSFTVGKLPLPNESYECHFRINGKEFNTPVAKNGGFRAALHGMPAGTYALRAELRERATGKPIADANFTVTLRKTPEIRDDQFKRLNNLVTEVLNADTESGKELTFHLPRNGWVYIQSPEGADMILDGKIRLTAPEMFQNLNAGKHTLKAAGGNGRIIVRSIPEILCYPVTAGGWQFVKKHVLGNVTTMNRSGEKLTEEQIREIRKTGAVVIASCGVRQTEDAMLKAMQSNDALKLPGISGFTSDECFFTNPQVLSNYVKALTKFDPKGKLVYTWIVGKPSTILHTDFMSAALNASDGRGRLLYEAYCIPYPTEEAERTYLDDMLVATFRQFKQFHPEAEKGTDIILGAFTRPGYMTLNSISEVDYKCALDIQMNVLANHPEFSQLGGVGYWGFSYADEEMIRWGYALLRHYAIEGNTEPLSKKYGFTYRLPFLKNCDFESGLEHWNTKGAVSSDSAAKIRYGGKNQKRWGGTGNTFCRFTKKPDATAEISQTAKGLTPGKLYALHFITADLKDIKANKIAPRRYGIDVTLKGAEVLPEKRMLSVNAGNKRDVAYINHHKLIFKANAPEVEVIFDNAKAQDGEELILNFIQLTPYFNH